MKIPLWYDRNCLLPANSKADEFELLVQLVMVMFLTDLLPTIEHYTALIHRCISTKNLKLGASLHAHLIKTSLYSDPFVANHLIHMYSKCSTVLSAHKAFKDLDWKNQHSLNAVVSAYSRGGHFKQALDLFDEMPDQDIVCYNTLISGLSRRGLYREAIAIFLRMQKVHDFVFMDEFTFVSVARSCACLGASKLLEQVHGVATVIGLKFNRIVYNSLIDAYGKCQKPDVSLSLFSVAPEKDVVTWTSMIVSYAHAGRIDDACKIFEEMPIRNTVSWTALITGFAQNGCGYEALNLFVRMLEEGNHPNPFTFVSVLTACASIAFVKTGKNVHCYIIRFSSISDCSNLFLSNALVDMYCKCGCIRSAERVFSMMREKDIVSWNSLLTGFAQNGLGHKALCFYKKMVEENHVKPNEVTFLGVLSACSHAGLDAEALKILDSMETVYGMKPGPDHMSVLIDLLGRKNRLEEAMLMVDRVSKKSNHVGMWGALLGACRVHYQDSYIAKRAAEALFDLEPWNAARYVMLANIYTAENRWDDASRVRQLMEDKGLKKDVGNSWIEVGNVRHEFAAKDRFHSEVGPICDVLRRLTDHVKEAGYVPELSTPYVFGDDDDDEQ